MILHNYYLDELDGSVVDWFLEFCLYGPKHLLPIVCNVTKWQPNNIELSKLQ